MPRTAARTPHHRINGGPATSAESAALRVRVDNLADDVHSIHTELRELAGTLSVQIRGLEAKQDLARQPNWQMWGVAITAMIALGTLAYWPILRSVDKNELAIMKLLEFAGSDAVVHKNNFQTTREALEKRGELNRLGVERLEAVSYTQHGQITALQAEAVVQDKRFDAVSRRLAEFIRDMGKH